MQKRDSYIQKGKFRNRIKGEKGSITVFVVAAMFFMLVILGLSYMGITNKNQAQIKDIAKIKEEHEVPDDQLEKVYEEVIEKVSVGVNFNANGGTYYIAKGGKVQISSAITIRESEGLKVTSAKYGWSTSELTPPSEWTTINGKEIVAFNPNCGKGKYYIWVSMEDSKGVKRSIKSNAFEVKASSITFSKSPEDWTKENVEVTVNYGEGLTKNRKIGIGATPEEAKVIATTNTEGKVTVGEVAYVYAEAEDEYGNKTDNTIYVDNIDKEPPTIKMIPDGGEYILREEISKTISVKVTAEDKQSGLKELKYAWSSSRSKKPEESEYTTIKSGDTVEKQAEEGTYYLWLIAEDNAGNIKPETSLEYKVRPPLAPTVTLKENNMDGANYTGAWTNQDVYTQVTVPASEGNVQKYEISQDGETWYEINGEEIPDVLNYENYTKTGNTIEYTITEEINKQLQIRALYEDGSYSPITLQFEIKIDKTKPTGEANYNFTSENKANIVISNIVEEKSGIKGYYVSEEDTEPTKESNWIEKKENTITIEELDVNKTYNVWLIDNSGNISEKIVVEVEGPAYRIDETKYEKTLEKALEQAQDGSIIYLLKDYEDASAVTITKNITLDVQNYTLTRTREITINGGKNVEIVGAGTITSATNNNTILNYGNLTINMDGMIENTNTNANYRAIQTNNTSSVVVNKGTVSGYNYGIITNGAAPRITINGGTVRNTNPNSGYAIDSGVITINGGNIEGYNGITGILTVNNGEIHAKERGISTNAQDHVTVINNVTIEANIGIYQQNVVPTIKILGGKIEGKTYGVYGNGPDRITIGDETKEVNDNAPIIIGNEYGIYMANASYRYNFKNGIIIGNNIKPYTETIVPREEYMVYVYYDYNTYRKYCAVLGQGVDRITITQNPESWTNQDVEVQVKYPSILNATMQFSEDGEEWIDVSNGYMTNISENKTVYARMLDSSGILLEKAEHEITNIDRVAPRVEISPEKTKYIIFDKESTTVDIDLNVTLQDEGGSGIKTSKYGWSTSKDNKPTQWFNLQDGTDIRETECNVGTYYLWFDIEDVAGNKCETEYVRYIVELQQAVAKIGENYYYTIQEAFDVANIGDTVEVIRDTNEEAVLGEGKDVILDLQGHSVANLNNNEDSIILQNNGILTIIDTSEGKTGTIEHLSGIAIENNGTLTIGNNEGKIEDSTPTISGKKIGIINNNTLNYYDGTIIGKIAIDGNVQSTPENYGPVSNFENGMSIINLRIVSNYVARIEWFYYTTLQGAIDDCTSRENNKEQTTITLIKDITLETSATTYLGQNIRLDLDGHTLTSNNDSVIKNYGELEITDLSLEQTGKISSSISGTNDNNRYNMIINYQKLTISGGRITTDKEYNNCVVNEKGNLYMENGIIEAGKESRGIVTLENAITEMKGGTINVNSESESITGLYNRGTTIIQKGTIISATTNNGTLRAIHNAKGTVSINRRRNK